MQLPIIQNNENPLLCSGCGRCCKQAAGIVFPEQLPSPITEELLIQKLEEGYCFSSCIILPRDVEKYPAAINGTAYYMRPRHMHALNKDYDRSWGGVCSFLTENGCKLSFEERPLQCQLLVPGEAVCHFLDTSYSDSAAVIAWLPYQPIINKILKQSYD